jgi:hypothetical protein
VNIRSSTKMQRTALSVSIDPIADASLQTYQTEKGSTALRCDGCDQPIEGEPFGRGLFMWTRGEERRFEEPALCASCSAAIGVTALAAWSVEEEEG